MKRLTFRYALWYWNEQQDFVNMKTDSYIKFTVYRLTKDWKHYEIVRRKRVKLAKKYEK